MFNEFLNNNIDNPKYLFHGSSRKLDSLKPHQSHDSLGKSVNIDNAVFLTSSFLVASAYAFMDSIKKLSEGLNYSFDIGAGTFNNEFKVFANIDNVNISDDIIGYIYVLPYNKDEMKLAGKIQYKCFNELKPLKVIPVKFSDFKEYYNITNYNDFSNKSL